MKCARCGFEVSNPSAAFCTSCGLPFGSSPVPTAPTIPVMPPAAVAPPAPVAPDFTPMAPAFTPETQPMPAEPYFGGAPQPVPYPADPGPDVPMAPYPGMAPMPPVSSPCGRCGAPIPAGVMFCNNCGTPVPPPQPARPPKKKLSKGALAAIISVVSLVVLVAGLFTGYLILRSSRYDKAVQAMNNGQYLDAQEAFESWILANYKDSADNAQFCRQTLLYNQATDALARADYTTAADLFKQIPGFQDADSLYTHCQDFLAAIAYYDGGQYWKAYDAFSMLSGDDAEIWMQKCIQFSPSEGIVEQGSAYATGNVDLTIDSWSASNIYFSIYSIDGGYWGSVYIEAWSDFTVSLPAGTYYFNVAFGRDWFGSEDLFGQGFNSSYYEHMDLGGQTEFPLVSNGQYTARLYG